MSRPSHGHLRGLPTNTEAFDRDEKRNRYQTWHTSSQDHFQVSHDQPEIGRFTRQPDAVCDLIQFRKAE